METTSPATAAPLPSAQTPRGMHWITVAVLDPDVINLDIASRFPEEHRV